MLKDRIRWILRIIRVLDISIAGIVFFVFLIFFPIGEPHRFAFRDIILLFSLTAVWCIMLNLFKVYTVFWTKRLPLVILSISKATIIGVFLMSGIFYILGIDNINRYFILAVFICTGLLLGIEKVLIMYFIKNHCWQDYNTKKILVVGTNPRARKLIELIDGSVDWGVKVVGVIDRDPSKSGDRIGKHIVMGDFSKMEDILHDNVIDEVVFVLPRGWLCDIEDLVRLCELEGVTVNIAVDHFDPRGSRISHTDLHGIPFLTIESAERSFLQSIAKRVIDFLISIVVLVLLSPLFLAVSIAIKLTSKGPVFFNQDRIGLNGRKFTVWKFRTMEVDAESKRDDLLSMNEMGGPVFKITNDPRITKIGKFLRKTSIDELPQLFVVLKGDMSLVGPRPLPVKENQYEIWQRRRLSVKPGITCIWQVSGRNKITDFSEWVKLDLEYIDNWSIWNDFLIMFKTIPAVLFVKGAK